MKKKKILMYGLGTYKNRGVEAIVQSTLNQIDSTKYDISAASHDFDYNKDKYTDRIKNYIKHYKKTTELNEEEKSLEEKYKNMPFDYNNFELLYQNEVVDELEKSDICISIGGDNYCYDFCTWLYALDKKSHELGKKTVLWCASLFEEISDLELINNLNNFDLIVIRESISYEAVRKYISEDKILLTKDPAFSLPIKKIKLNEWYSKNKNYVVLNFSPLTIDSTDNDSSQYKAIIDLMNYILEKTKYSICLLPHVTTDDCNDLTILAELESKFKTNKRVYLEKGNYNCNELKYIISKSQLLVAARTHASIAAYSTCVPTLVIGYSVKSRGIAKDLFGNVDNYVIDKNTMNSTNLISKFNYINSNKDEIRKCLEEQMPAIIEETSHIFEKVIDRLNLQEKLTICNKSDCIGCGLCAYNCPSKAIVMEKNIEGYLYPKIDIEKCTKCNICRKKCPIKEKENVTSSFEKEYYAAKNRNKEERTNSTSGGIFSVLAREILKKKGIVYGCQMTDYEANHIRITKVSELEKIRGSKYIQSNITNIFTDLKKDLNSKKTVLFAGTPCQIGTIKKLLNKKYDNLITVSVICHGVLNDTYLKKYINGLEIKTNKKVNDWKFRVKDNGWTKSSIKYNLDTEKKVVKFIDDDLMYLYLKDVLTRESCYSCKYKGNNDLADITLGDYWGIEVTNKDFYDENGVSVLIINTKKGQNFISKNKILEQLDTIPGNYTDIIKYNPSLINSIKRPLKRNLVSKHFEEGDFLTELSKIREQIELEEYKETIKKLETKNESLSIENIELANKLNDIYSSKRWKVIDKIGNVLNAIRRVK